LYGAIIGAVVVNYAKTNFTGEFPDYWPFMLGGLFVVCTMFLPKGISGAVSQYRQNRANKKAVGLSAKKEPTIEAEAM
jgi:urea transport system permease protein